MIFRITTNCDMKDVLAANKTTEVKIGENAVTITRDMVKYDEVEEKISGESILPLYTHYIYLLL